MKYEIKPIILGIVLIIFSLYILNEYTEERNKNSKNVDNKKEIILSWVFLVTLFIGIGIIIAEIICLIEDRKHNEIQNNHTKRIQR